MLQLRSIYADKIVSDRTIAEVLKNLKLPRNFLLCISFDNNHA